MTGGEFKASFFAKHPVAESLFALFDCLPNVYFYAKDAEHRYVGVNRAVAREVFGLEDEGALLGKSDLEFQPPALAEAYHAEDVRVMEKGGIIPREVWLVPHVDGTPRWYVSSKTPLFDPEGKVVGVVGVMYPIRTPEDQAAHFRELGEVLRHIETNFTENVSMAEMAQMAGLSSTQFNQRFRELLRMSPSDFLLKLRVDAAQRLLTATSRSISEVAVAVGFFDQSHFAKRFRRVTGMSPLAYRKRFQ